VWVLAALLHTDLVDYKKLADAVGVNRRDLRSVAASDIQVELGFEIGGVGPFPICDKTEIVIDDTARDLTSILCGSGKNTCSIEIDVRDLVRVANAIVAPISRK